MRTTALCDGRTYIYGHQFRTRILMTLLWNSICDLSFLMRLLGARGVNDRPPVPLKVSITLILASDNRPTTRSAEGRGRDRRADHERPGRKSVMRHSPSKTGRPASASFQYQSCRPPKLPPMWEHVQGTRMECKGKRW